MHRSESRPAGIVAWAMSVFLMALATLLTAHPAAADTYTVTSAVCTGTDSITEAMDNANANTGVIDIIDFEENLVVDFATCPPFDAPPDALDYFALQATESVIFEGKGAKLSGQMVWISSGGVNQAGYSCTEDADAILALTPGFIQVGRRDQDNSAITVTVRDLDMERLSAVATIETDASLVMEDLKLSYIYAQPKDECRTPAITAAGGANFSAYGTEWNRIWNDADVLGGGSVLSGVIGSFAGDSGNLTVEDSHFLNIGSAGVISWVGQRDSVVNIVSSRFDENHRVHATVCIG